MTASLFIRARKLMNRGRFARVLVGLSMALFERLYGGL